MVRTIVPGEKAVCEEDGGCPHPLPEIVVIHLK
jgi:hypothetical protein